MNLMNFINLIHLKGKWIPALGYRAGGGMPDYQCWRIGGVGAHLDCKKHMVYTGHISSISTKYEHHMKIM